MAASHPVQWTILIVVDEDGDLNSMYRKRSDIRLMELMEIWKNDFDLNGNWQFVLEEHHQTCDIEEMTVQMVGETKPRSRIVTLKASLFDEPVNEIFICLEDKCHQLDVAPHEKLGEAISRLTNKPTTFEYNGELLNLKQTTIQAGLKNKSVIYESPCRVTVKLSTGISTVIRLPSNSLVFHLVEMVKVYENDNFSLIYQGKYLNGDERVKELTQIVQVTTTDFAVHLRDRCIIWRTKSGPVAFSEFISQLSVKADIDMETLEKMEFCFIGCRHSEYNLRENHQPQSTQLYKGNSLTLNVLSEPNMRDESGAKGTDEYIRHFYGDLVDHRRKDSRTEETRGTCSKAKDKLSEEGIDYNFIISCSERLHKAINEVENKNKTLENDVQSLKKTNMNLEMIIETSVVDLKVLKANDAKLKEENTKFATDLAVLKGDNVKLKEENMKFATSIKLLMDNYVKFAADIREIKEDNVKLKQENSKLAAKIKVLRSGEDLSFAADIKELRKDLGMKLLIFYRADEFSPISCLEIQKQEDYSWNVGYRHVKCRIPTMQEGWTTFEAVQTALTTMFTNCKDIRIITQRRGKLQGKDVAEVTSRCEDEAQNWDKGNYSGVAGEQFSYGEVKPKVHDIRARGRVFISGQRRTVLYIVA